MYIERLVFNLYAIIYTFSSLDRLKVNNNKFIIVFFINEMCLLHKENIFNT